MIIDLFGREPDSRIKRFKKDYLNQPNADLIGDSNEDKMN